MNRGFMVAFEVISPFFRDFLMLFMLDQVDCSHGFALRLEGIDREVASNLWLHKIYPKNCLL